MINNKNRNQFLDNPWWPCWHERVPCSSRPNRSQASPAGVIITKEQQWLMIKQEIKTKKKTKNKSVKSKSKKSNLFSNFLYKELLQKLSYKLNVASGIVISFGNNNHN